VCGPALSRDGERVAFVTWKGGRNVVIRDGEEGEEFDAISWPLALSADGKTVAYQARQGEHQFCVVGHRKSRSYRSVGLPALSEDGSVVAFAASNDDGWRVVRNGKSGPRFDWVGNLVLHPGGGRLAYSAEAREAGKLKCFIVVDGVAGPSFDRVTPPVLSGDGGTVAYAGLRDGEWSIIAGRRASPVRGEVTRVILSHDGAEVGFVVDEGTHRRLITPSGVGPEFDSIADASFLKDGRVVYLASRAARKYLCVEDQRLPLGTSQASGLRPLPDGTHVGVVVREDRTVEWKILQVPARRGAIAKE
jgi:hypothetical protein